LYSIRDILTDAELRFRLGKKEYARWRLQSLSSHCVSCHARFAFGEAFQQGAVLPTGLTSFEEGEFYLATRQFDLAKKSFIATARDHNLPATDRMNALRKVLLSQVRISENAQETLTLFTKLSSELTLPDSQQAELDQWIRSLRRWVNESSSRVSEFRRAVNLIEQFRNAPNPGEGQVELLRASAIFHRLLALDDPEGTPTEHLSADARAKALFLLGEAYSQMPAFFTNELPEFYYERCIQEYPGTLTAQDAYRSYYNLLVLNYSGSAGLDLPKEVQSKLRVLHERAFGESEKVQ
jgi:hypothetical protein